MRLSPILKYQFAIDIQVISTEGGAAVATDEISANEAVATHFTRLRFIVLSPCASRIDSLWSRLTSGDDSSVGDFPSGRCFRSECRLRGYRAGAWNVRLVSGAFVHFHCERLLSEMAAGLRAAIRAGACEPDAIDVEFAAPRRCSVKGLEMPNMPGRLVDIGDTELHVVERGSGHPLLLLHGGPGLDHRMFGDYLDGLADACRLIFVDQRANGRSGRPPESTWTLAQHAADVGLLASALGLGRFAVLGHSYGSFVALQHAVDFPGQASQTIISSGVPGSRFLMSHVERELAAFEPENLRRQVTESWTREQTVQSADELAMLMSQQLPFHFGDPLDPRIADYERRTAGAVFSPEVLRKFSADGYGSIEVEDRLAAVPQPVLVLAGRFDRTCSVEAAACIASGISGAEMVVFEHSGHMTFAEETDQYVASVRDFLRRRVG